jgi:hypothetical protein
MKFIRVGLLAFLCCCAAGPGEKQRYDLRPLLQVLHPKGAQSADRPVKRGTKSIGMTALPADGVTSLREAIAAHVEPEAWTSGEAATEKGDEGKVSFSLRAAPSVHAGVKRLMAALAKPINIDPDASVDQIKKLAAVSDEKRGLVTLVYRIDTLPASVVSLRFGGGDVTREKVVREFRKRVERNVTPDAWEKDARLDLLSGRMIVTNTPEAHAELSKRVSGWCGEKKKK